MKTCVRCGESLNKFQRKYCSTCETLVRRERDLKRSHKKKDDSTERDYALWEAPICFNCTKPICTNCLSHMSAATKKALLVKIESEGKAWID